MTTDAQRKDRVQTPIQPLREGKIIVEKKYEGARKCKKGVSERKKEEMEEKIIESNENTKQRKRSKEL